MKYKFSNIIHSFNLFERICLGVVFLEFIFFISPGNPPSTVHLYLLLFIPLLIIGNSKKPRKYKYLTMFLYIFFISKLSTKSSYLYNLVLVMGLNIQLIVSITFIIAVIISINIRKDKKAPLKSFIVLGMFSLIFLSIILYNNSHFISNPQLRRDMYSKVSSSRPEEELSLKITTLKIGENSNITNLKDVEKFENLRMLSVDGYAYNIDGLFELEKLDFIKFYNSNSNILYKINEFKTLKTLKFFDFPSIEDGFKLNDLPNLESLLIWETPVDCLDFIGELDNLQLISLLGIKLNNVDAIQNLNSLKILDLYDVQINNIDGVLLNDSIEEIRYVHSNITDYEDVLKEKGIKLVKK